MQELSFACPDSNEQVMEPGRRKRREKIKRSLAFIQSSLPYPEPGGYQDFLTKLVCNLLEEGNTLFREGQWQQAVKEFSEGLNVSHYATANDVPIPVVLLESLYVNRAAAYHSMGHYDQGVTDCDRALEVCKESRRALYRKALCLTKLGKYREAYNCTTDCLLTSHQDKQMNELAQELAIHLGLKNRTPYVSTKLPGPCFGNDMNPPSGPAPVSFPCMSQATIPSGVPGLLDSVEDSELIGEDLDSLLDQDPTEVSTAFLVPNRTSPCTQIAPSGLPPPTPRLPPAFFSSGISQLDSLDLFLGGSTTGVTLDSLDDFSPSESGCTSNSTPVALDSLDDLLDKATAAQNRTEVDAGEYSLGCLDKLEHLNAVTDLGGLSAVAPKPDVKAAEQLDSLDTLDSFPAVEDVGVPLPPGSLIESSLDLLSNFNSTGNKGGFIAGTPVVSSPKKNNKENRNQAKVTGSNPLSSTHEFLQACFACFPRKGAGIYTYVHKPDLVHSCKRDILLCRRKAVHPLEWTRVRTIPKVPSFNGPYVLCRELLQSGDRGICKYGENCTFAYNQLEIDVWTEERKGTLDRNQLFEKKAVKLDSVNGTIHLLQEHKGTFLFLCQECYDHKPRIISKRRKDSPTACSNTDARHTFDANKCLAFVTENHGVNYSKVRPLSVLCQLDLCRKAIRLHCPREDSCTYAHSVIELKTWRVQRDTGMSQEEIVKVSTEYYDKQGQSSSKHKGNRLIFGGGASKSKGGGDARKSLDMKIIFACASCWRDSRISEPDRALKYCTAKARHTWTKDRCLLLVKSSERSKWVQVRPLPHAKNFPLHYDICNKILEKKKCNYFGNCSFAHSQEEKDMWTYMKNNDLHDMQQIYDKWLTQRDIHNRQTEGAMHSQPAPEEKNIVMPTDFAEPLNGFYCHLCGRHSNSERQWQQHVSSEKHKDRVFSCEGEEEALTWNYRFPGKCVELCPKLDNGCSDGVSCDYAHSLDELQEWTERREFLRQKLARAREDMLILPHELDFGKYNFLLKD